MRLHTMANLSKKERAKGHQGPQQSSEVDGDWQVIAMANGQRTLQFSILVCGKSGIGKSSLINFIIGRDVCEVGDPGAFDGTLDAQTMAVTEYPVKANGVLVRIFDSPGLQDGTKNDEVYLDLMYAKCRDVDLIFYCHDMPSPRWTDHEVNALRLFTAKFGPTFWDKAVFVLTKANMVQPTKRMTEKEKRDHFQNWTSNSAKRFRGELMQQLQAMPAEAGKPMKDGKHVHATEHATGKHAQNGVGERKEGITAQQRVDRIPAVPTGSELVQILPNGKHFIGDLWVNCIERITDPYLTEVFMKATNFKERLVTHEEIEKKGHSFGITLEDVVHAGKELAKDIWYEFTHADEVTTGQHADIELAPQNPTKEAESTLQPSEQPPTLPTPEPPKEPFSQKELPKDPSKESELSKESFEESSEESSSKESKESSEEIPQYLIAVDDELSSRLAEDVRKKQLVIETAAYSTGGAVGGAAAGAVVGSVVPVIGTAIGAGVGAGVGAVFGGGLSWLKNRLWG